jgi:hypothetical protein
MQNELEVLRDATQKLSQAGIDYMLTGSLALAYYAEPRMTRDIDIVVAVEPKTADEFIRVFESSYYVPIDAARQAIANQSMFNVLHNEFIVKVDLIIRKHTQYRQTEFNRRRQVQIYDLSIWIVSKEDLIISKLEWASDSHSEFQLRDVRKLLKSGYDAAYLGEWTKQLGLTQLLNECLDE